MLLMAWLLLILFSVEVRMQVVNVATLLRLSFQAW